MNKRNTHEARKKERKYPAKLAKDKNKIGRRREGGAQHAAGRRRRREGQTKLGQSKPAMRQTLGEGEMEKRNVLIQRSRNGERRKKGSKPLRIPATSAGGSSNSNKIK